MLNDLMESSVRNDALFRCLKSWSLRHAARDAAFSRCFIEKRQNL